MGTDNITQVDIYHCHSYLWLRISRLKTQCLGTITMYYLSNCMCWPNSDVGSVWWPGAQPQLLTGVPTMWHFHVAWAFHSMVTVLTVDIPTQGQTLPILLKSRLKLAQISQGPPTFKRRGNRLHLSMWVMKKNLCASVISLSYHSYVFLILLWPDENVVTKDWFLSVDLC